MLPVHRNVPQWRTYGTVPFPRVLLLLNEARATVEVDHFDHEAHRLEELTISHET